MLEFTNKALTEMYERGVVVDGNNQEHKVKGFVPPSYANALYNTIKKHQFKTCIEIGMAYGGSTLAILSALSDVAKETNQPVKLISVDPYQKDYGKIGLWNIQREGFNNIHEWVEQPDFLALPELVRQNVQIDFAYIDGMHTFDYVLLDFFFIDKLLRPGGIVAFNDCHYPAIFKVIKYVLSHRRYDEINVGLKPNYRNRNPIKYLYRVITRFGKQDRYFQKKEQWEPHYKFFKNF